MPGTKLSPVKSTQRRPVSVVVRGLKRAGSNIEGAKGAGGAKTVEGAGTRASGAVEGGAREVVSPASSNPEGSCLVLVLPVPFL